MRRIIARVFNLSSAVSKGAGGIGANLPSVGGWLRRAELGWWLGTRLRALGVVFVLGDVLFVSRRLMGSSHCLFGLQHVFGELFQHLLAQPELIYDESYASRTTLGSILDCEGLYQPSSLLLATDQLAKGRVPPFVRGSRTRSRPDARRLPYATGRSWW